jgi:hypothetical protein
MSDEKKNSKQRSFVYGVRGMLSWKIWWRIPIRSLPSGAASRSGKQETTCSTRLIHRLNPLLLLSYFTSSDFQVHPFVPYHDSWSFQFPVAKHVWIAVLLTLAAAPAIKPWGYALVPSRGLHPLQMPFAVSNKWITHTHSVIHKFCMMLGPIGGCASIHAGYIRKYSSMLYEYPEPFRFAARNLLFPLVS